MRFREEPCAAGARAGCWSIDAQRRGAGYSTLAVSQLAYRATGY